MTLPRGPFSFFLALFVTVLPPLQAETPLPWAAIEVPADSEPSATALLESHGVATLAWSNAVVEVSAFDAVELRPLSNLDQTLSEPDPRWDPWLAGLKPLFLPAPGLALILVDPSHTHEAAALLGGSARVPGTAAPEPRRITGWMAAFFAFVYLLLHLFVTLGRGEGRDWRKWLWLPLTLAVLVAGLALTTGGAAPRPAMAVQTSWLQHLWFQQSWPFGAQWNDWKPGQAWTYLTYQRGGGQIVESRASLAVPDAVWARAAYEGLDKHHAARLLPPEMP